MSRSEFIFAQCFCLLHLGFRCLWHTVDAGRILERTLKKHSECYSNEGSHKPLDLSGILVCTLWHRHAHIIYTLGYITQTNLNAHTPQPKKQHMHKTGSGATTERCCFNGSGPVATAAYVEKLGCCQRCSQQPLNEPSTLTAGHMVLRPLGHSVPVCLRCCQGSFQSFIFLALAPGAIPFNANQSPAADATHWARHWATEDSPMCLWQEAENQADITTLLPSSQIDGYKSVFAPLSTAAWVFKSLYKDKILKQQNENMLTCCWKTVLEATLRLCSNVTIGPVLLCTVPLSSSLKTYH